MSDSAWDTKMRAFLKKTGEDFKRFGKDVKDEAQKLMGEVKDPERQQKLREGLKDVGHWARKTAEEVATVMETGVKKAEGAFRSASGKVTDFVSKEPPGAPAAARAPEPAPTPPSPPPEMEPPPKPKAAKKSVGPRAKKSGAKKAGAAKKTIGKKASGPGE
ncbi:MAG: transcriptional regulator [Myxococcales bacterium]|nr:transcriptional regulator [Myxococcales bacterium]